MRYLLISLFLLSSWCVKAQQPVDSTQFDEVRSLVNFYKYMLNTVGGNNTSTRDKEVIIKESFKKVFKDEFVQIEDDLILDRKVITNKDVGAYLRDVDFFFNDLQFNFNEVKIERIVASDSSYYFLASFESSTQGNTIENEPHSDNRQRFIEVNLNEESNDLKIVSVYTTKVSRERELQLWWENLSFGWRDIFKELVPFDTISNGVLKKIADLDSLSLSGNLFIQDIEPLSALKDLKSLDISNTKIADLNPLRYSRKLEQLNASNTKIDDISVLPYFDGLQSLNISHSMVMDLSPLAHSRQLKQLHINDTPISDFSPLKQVKTLEEINISNTSMDDPTLLSSNLGLKKVDLSKTPVDHLFVFGSLPTVQSLDLTGSQIANLNGLEKHPGLEQLVINQTLVQSLKQLDGLPKLGNVYADNSGITDEMASSFMAKHPAVVVVTNSEGLMKWWTTLPTNWQTALSGLLSSQSPSKEELAKLMVIDSLNLANKKLYIEKPLFKFKRLRFLDVSYNDFVTLDFAREMPDLETLIGTGLPVNSTQVLAANKKLNTLKLNQTQLKNLDSLSQLHNLKLVDVDGTQVSEDQVVKHLATSPETVILYQSDSLLAWWNNLSPTWQSTFNLENSSSYELHQLIEKQHIEISGNKILSLAPLKAFINLKSIAMDKMRLYELSELYSHKGLKSIAYTNGPLNSLSGIDQLTNLESLDISNTSMEELKELYKVKSLRHLNCSGTNIKNFKGVDYLENMESMDVSNTRIWRLERLYVMKKLKSLICYNTRLSQAKVDEFQVLFPDCDITFY